jgi:hypothetical protein
MMISTSANDTPRELLFAEDEETKDEERRMVPPVEPVPPPLIPALRSSAGLLTVLALRMGIGVKGPSGDRSASACSAAKAALRAAESRLGAARVGGGGTGLPPT